VARRIAHAEWTGELADGRGQVSVGGETLGLAYTPAWLQEGAGTNPEELLAAAHAASFAMALEAAFSRADHRTHVVRTRAELHLDRREDTWTITRCHLEGQVSLDDETSTRDLFQDEFRRIVEEAASSSPISRALAGVESRSLQNGTAPAAKQIPPQTRQDRSIGTAIAIAASGEPSRVRSSAGSAHEQGTVVRRVRSPSVARTSDRRAP